MLGNSLLTQFEDSSSTLTIPFVDSRKVLSRYGR